MFTSKGEKTPLYRRKKACYEGEGEGARKFQFSTREVTLQGHIAATRCGTRNVIGDGLNRPTTIVVIIIATLFDSLHDINHSSTDTRHTIIFQSLSIVDYYYSVVINKSVLLKVDFSTNRQFGQFSNGPNSEFTSYIIVYQ